MNIIHIIISWTAGIILCASTVTQILIILFFGIPHSLNLNRLGRLKSLAPLRMQIISLIILTSIFSILYWLVYNYFHRFILEFDIGIGMAFFKSLSKVGANNNNLSDFNEVFESYIKDNSNLNPEIKFFESNKNIIYIAGEIIFRWKTINADVVILEPLGPVNNSGEITHKILYSQLNQIPFKLVAINSNSNVKSEKEIIVSNITFENFKKIVHQDSNNYKNFSASYIQQESYLKQNKYYNAFMNIIHSIWVKLSVTIAFIISVGLAMYIVYILFKIFIDFKKQ